MNRHIRRLVAALGALAFAGACGCEDDEALQGRAPRLEVIARFSSGDTLEVLPGPKTVPFGDAGIGSEVRVQVELSNAGTVDLEFTAPPELSEGTSFELREVLTLACSGEEAPASSTLLSPGSCAALVAVFRPTAEGDATDELVLRTNDPVNATLRVPLSASGVAGGLTVCEGASCVGPGQELTVDFGTLAIGGSAERELVVKNAGRLVLEAMPYVFEGSPEIGVRPGPAAYTLEPGAEQPFTATFSPAVGGSRTARMTVSTEDGAQVVVNFVGVGDAPALCVEPFPTLDFGDVTEQTTASQPVTLTSCGTLPVELRGVELLTNGEYALPGGAPATPATLAPGESLSVEVAFTPPAVSTSPFPGRLKFTSDAPGSETLYVALTGMGVPPEVCDLRPQAPSLSFGQTLFGSSTRADVIFQNLGRAACVLEPGSIAVTAGQGGLFRLVSMPAMPATVGPLGSATALVRVTVEYVPADVTAPDTATLAASPSGAPAASVALSGTALDPAQFPCLLSAAPAAMQFGLEPTGRTAVGTVRLTNVGTETCSITQSNVTSGAPVFNVTVQPLPLLGTPVEPGGFYDLPVNFRPTVDGIFTGNLRVTYKEGGFGGGNTLNVDVPLAGEGRSPSLCVNPTELDFGQVPAGTTGRRSVDVLNCGGVPLVLRGVSIRAGSHPGFSRTPVAGIPRTLQPGDTVAVEVLANARTAAGMYGTLELLSDDADEPTLAVPLRANASDCERAITCTPSPLDFGDVDVSTSLVRSVVCQNPGSTDVAIRPTIGAPFVVLSAPASIPAGQAAAITVLFTPQASGAASGTLSLGANDCGGGAMNVPVSGNGVVDRLPICITPARFSPDVVWTWDGGGVLPNATQVWASPIVSRLEDTDGDGRLTRADMPRVIIPTFDRRDWDSVNDPAGAVPGVMRALDGATGAEVWTNTDAAARVNSGATPAVIDLDADGSPEIITQAFVDIEGTADIPNGPKVRGKYVRGNLIAFNADGTVRWISEEWTRDDVDIEDMGAVSVGDVDGDGFAEIATGDNLFDRNGALLWRGGRGIGGAGHGPISVLVDLDGQPGLELLAGRTAYRANGSVLWDRQDLDDGLPQVADLDGDGDSEVVLRSGEITVLDARTGATVAGPLWPPVDISMGRECVQGTNEGDPDCNTIPSHAVILDLDGDGTREIVVANRNVLIAYDRNLDEVWRNEISDQTGASGPAGFDFEGDGALESIYSDEDSIYVHDAVGDEIYRASHQSVTLMESVAVADADLDGHANLVIISNEPMFGSAGNVQLITNSSVSWVSARGIWNQHAFVEPLVGELATPVANHTDALTGFRTATPACR